MPFNIDSELLNTNTATTKTQTFTIVINTTDPVTATAVHNRIPQFVSNLGDNAHVTITSREHVSKSFDNDDF